LDDEDDVAVADSEAECSAAVADEVLVAPVGVDSLDPPVDPPVEVLLLAAALGLVVGSPVGCGAEVVGFADVVGEVEVLGDVEGEVDGDVDGVLEVGGFELGLVLVDVLGLGVADVVVGSGSGSPSTGPSVTPSTEPNTRVAWNRRVQRTGTSRTLSPVRGASTM